MKTAGVLLLALCLSVGCATSPTPDTSDDNDTASPTTSTKKSSNDSTPAPTESSSGSISSSTTDDASTADASSDPTDTDSDAGGGNSDDDAACADLGSCCPQLTDSFSQIACLGAQISGDPTTCAAALIACEAETSAGSSSGGDMTGAAGSPCLTDDDCSGVLLCESSVCSE